MNQTNAVRCSNSSEKRDIQIERTLFVKTVLLFSVRHGNIRRRFCAFLSLENSEKISQEVDKILKKNLGDFSKQYLKLSHDDREQQRKLWVFSGKVTHAILERILKEKGVYAKSNAHSDSELDVILLEKGVEIGHIEVKRLLSTNNLHNGLSEHIDKVKRCKGSKFYFLCIFPLLPADSADRVNDLTIGYRNIINEEHQRMKREGITFLLGISPEKDSVKQIGEAIDYLCTHIAKYRKFNGK